MTTTIQPNPQTPDILAALQWRHNNAARLTSLLQSKQAWLDVAQQGFWVDWTRDVFDVRTANDFGLALWCIILGLNIRRKSDSDTGRTDAWGFGTDNINYSHGNFLPQYSSGAGLDLTTGEVRTLVRLRYYSLTCRPCTMQLNEWFADNIPEISVADNTIMGAIAYRFKHPLSNSMMYALTNLDILPRPATLGLSIAILDREAFGYGEYNLNFDNGSFYN